MSLWLKFPASGRLVRLMSRSISSEGFGDEDADDALSFSIKFCLILFDIAFGQMKYLISRED